MAQIKAKITSKEKISNIQLPGFPEFIPMKIIREKPKKEGQEGKFKESVGEVLIEESRLGELQALGKKYDFTIKRA